MSGGSRPANQETRKEKDTPYESQHKQIKKIINQQSFRKLKDYLQSIFKPNNKAKANKNFSLLFNNYFIIIFNQSTIGGGATLFNVF